MGVRRNLARVRCKLRLEGGLTSSVFFTGASSSRLAGKRLHTNPFEGHLHGVPFSLPSVAYAQLLHYGSEGAVVRPWGALSGPRDEAGSVKTRYRKPGARI